MNNMFNSAETKVLLFRNSLVQFVQNQMNPGIQKQCTSLFATLWQSGIPFSTTLGTAFFTAVIRARFSSTASLFSKKNAPGVFKNARAAPDGVARGIFSFMKDLSCSNLLHSFIALSSRMTDAHKLQVLKFVHTFDTTYPHRHSNASTLSRMKRANICYVGQITDTGFGFWLAFRSFMPTSISTHEAV